MVYANNRRGHTGERPGGYTDKERRETTGEPGTVCGARARGVVYRGRVSTHGARAQYEKTINQGLRTI